MLLITNYLPNTHVNYPSPNFIPLYSMINMHTKLWHTAIHSVTFFLRGLRIVREQLLFILGLYQGHNQSQNPKLPQTPSCKGNRTTGLLKLCTYF